MFANIGQMSVLPCPLRLFPILLVGICFLQPNGNQAWDRSRPQLLQSIKSFWNFCNFHLMIESLGNWTKIDYSDPITSHRGKMPRVDACARFGVAF